MMTSTLIFTAPTQNRAPRLVNRLERICWLRAGKPTRDTLPADTFG